jgi:hypothetical protein
LPDCPGFQFLPPDFTPLRAIDYRCPVRIYFIVIDFKVQAS